MNSFQRNFEQPPDEDDTTYHIHPKGDSPAAMKGVSRRSSNLSVWSSDSVQAETFDAEKAPRLRRRGTVLSMSTHYTESSFGSHTELSEMLITRTVSSAGMRHKHQKPDPGFSIARERRKRNQQDRLIKTVRTIKQTTEPAPVLKSYSEPATPVKSAGVRLKGHEGNVTLYEDRTKPEPGTAAHQRIASAEATARLIRHAREVLDASDAEMMRLQNETGFGDGVIPQRRNTTGVLSRNMAAAKIQPKRATADGFDQVNGASCNLESITKPSKRIKELMARFDREIRARVEADVQRRRLQKEAASHGKPYMLAEPQYSDMGRNKTTMQPTRPNIMEDNRTLSSSETIVVNEEGQMDDSEGLVEGGIMLGIKETYDQIVSLNRTMSVEDEPSAGLELSIISSYGEGSVIPEQAVAAPMVPVRKARLVKVPPRSVSVKRARNADDSSQISPRRQRSQLDFPKNPDRTPTKHHLADGQSDGNLSPGHGLNKKEMELIQILSPEDLVVGSEVIKDWPEETKRRSSCSTSPSERPRGALSYHLGGWDEEQYGDQEEDRDETMSFLSVGCVADGVPTLSPTASLFNMPNSPFLYHTEHDDECPSLTTDDDQDRRAEEAWLGARQDQDQDQAPPPPSPTFQPKLSATATDGEDTEGVVLTGASTDGSSTYATMRTKIAQVMVEVEGDGFSGMSRSDNLYQGQACDGCDVGEWTAEMEEGGLEGVERCSFSAEADKWRRWI